MKDQVILDRAEYLKRKEMTEGFHRFLFEQESDWSDINCGQESDWSYINKKWNDWLK